MTTTPPPPTTAPWFQTHSTKDVVPVTLFLLHTFPSNHRTHSSSLFHVKCSFNFRPTPSRKVPTIKATIPARDRVMDFRKHKGKMFPSTYLKWVSNNLRACDFKDWAKLVDQVLQDPIYKDWIEWEFAENLLNGNNNVSSRNGFQSCWK